ncbi:HupE/UreJ family protein [Luteolibacter arcticus]|uniref:HupE/UreJ family protein n=1 Tax=Luteolibacter arcticus TaxID=1581411 RepID=A0ABT3GE10_9BACT|nr:HupE/UreJ family protein [Luteolibacter arcticus]MCW1921856.1 HupE/UreJ family protein [Luteolibacter arcticus]
MFRLLLLVWLLFTGVAAAHQIAEVSMSVALDGDRVTAIADADAAYMLPEFRGDEDEEAKDLAWLREQGPDGWRKIARECEAYWRDCLRVKAGDQELAWTLRVPDLEKEKPGFLENGDPEELPMLEVVIEATLPTGATKLGVAWKEPFGVNLIVTTGEGESAETKPFVSGEEGVVAERTAAETEMKPAETSVAGWIKLGFIHILPKGVDHILFVLGLFLLVPKWKPLLQQTIVFTLAHSLSLAAAALGWVRFPSTPVEILIAASIAWVGIENFWAKELGKGRLILVGIFGLVHGLGFAGVLAELLPAGQPEKLPAALLGFNVGVELGQIAVLMLAFLVVSAFTLAHFVFRRVTNRLVQKALPDSWRVSCNWSYARHVWVKRIGSVMVALAGLILVIERVANIEIVPFL